MTRRVAAFALAFAFSLTLAAPVDARDREKERRAAERARKNYTVGEYAYKKLSASHELIGEEKYDEARALLDQLAKRRHINPHERALLFQTYGYIESSKEEYASAANYFQKCLAENALPLGAQLNTQYNLGQLYLAIEEYQKSVDTLNAWFEVAENPGPAAYYLLAVAYVQMEQHGPALAPALKAIEKLEKAKEGWIQLALSLRFQRGELKEVAKLLEQLVIRFPKKSYWKQLSAVYSELGRDKDSLAVLQLSYQQGFLQKDRELRNLAQLYLFQQIPYRAALVMEKGLSSGTIEADTKSWQLLADAWLFAREYDRALAPLEKAAKLADDGQLYIRLAQIHMEDEGWKEAEQALASAIGKGGLDSPGTAQLLLGITRYNQKRISQAEKAFRLAKKHEKTRKAAKRWLTHIQRERDRDRQSG